MFFHQKEPDPVSHRMLSNMSRHQLPMCPQKVLETKVPTLLMQWVCMCAKIVSAAVCPSVNSQDVQGIKGSWKRYDFTANCSIEGIFDSQASSPQLVCVWECVCVCETSQLRGQACFRFSRQVRLFTQLKQCMTAHPYLQKRERRVTLETCETLWCVREALSGYKN